MGRRAGDRSKKRWIARVAAALVLALACAWLPYRLAVGDSGSAGRLRAELDRVRGKAAELERKNAALLREVRALKRDPRAIEDVARAELGFVRPGEMLLRIERPSAGTESDR